MGANKRIIVLGDLASVIGFRGLGLETMVMDTAEDRHVLVERLNRLVYADDYAIIYITDALFVKVKDLIAELLERPLPAIIRLPMGPQSGSDPVRDLEETVKRAVGFDILGGER